MATESQANEMRQRLRAAFHARHGSLAAFAKHRGVTKEWVRQVMSGEVEDYDLLIAAIEFLPTYKTEREQRIEQGRIRFVEVAQSALVIA